jgi:hypothetical protein
LEAQEEARRKEMQARIDNMLRSAYVLPPLPQPPAPMPTYYDTFPSPVPPVDPGFVMDIPTFQPPVRDTTPDFEMQPPMPTPAPMLIEPPVRVVQPKTTSYVPAYSPQPPAKPGELGYVPPMPVDPGFVMDIPTFRPPMPEIPNVGLIDNRIGPGFGKPMQPTPSPIGNMSSSILDALRQLQPSAPGNTDYGQPAQPSAGMGLSRLAPPEPYTPPVFEPYTPPMAEPYTPPSMQFSVDMPRMNYARDLYGVNPDNVSMLKRGGLAVKPKKGKC